MAADTSAAELPARGSRETQRFGTIVVVGGGCYGSYYLRQLARAANAGAVEWDRVVVVDRDPRCTAASTAAGRELHGLEVVTAEWGAYFARYLAEAAERPPAHQHDAIVPSPLMPHLMAEWLLDRARARWPDRFVGTTPLDRAPDVPWQRNGAGDTHYVSFAEWMCPINCIEPARCPHTRGERSWSLPPAVHAYVEKERAAGRPLGGPFIFHCVHRAFGVGMLDVRDVVAADRAIAEEGARGATAVLVGTMSHCHGALQRLVVGA
ncbi:MAG: hypothetical protein ACHQRK_07675 [Gemmatimonadales bacterium]